MCCLLCPSTWRGIITDDMNTNVNSHASSPAQSVGVISLGCAKNRVDTEQMLALLTGWGYTLTDHAEKADILIVNTCGFIAPAKEESIDTLLQMAAYKKTGHCRLLIATGCLVQRYAEDLHAQLPEVDALLGVGEYPRLKELIEQAARGIRPVACNRTQEVFEGKRILTTPAYSAYIRTGDGCDNRCAYCAIPLIRGGYRSRSFASIEGEVEALARRGVQEITFIAQDTTRYGDDLSEGKRLADLIRMAAKHPHVRWVRALYCYPSHVDDRLLDVLANEPKACGYLDLPLQHIDGGMLRAMNRHGSPEEIRALISKIRDRGLTLRTTLIVGFPGETESAFQRLLDFVEEVRFDRLGAFAYSEEEDTPAATMPGQVPEEIKEKRLNQLMRLQQQISLKNNQRRIGSTVEALVEGTRDGIYLARTRMEAPEGDGLFLLSSQKVLEPGSFVNARVTGANAYDIIGETL